MTLPQIIGELIPGAFQDLITSLRAKYTIPPPNPGEDNLPLVLAEDIPLEDIRAQIYSNVQASMVQDPSLAPVLGPFQTLPPQMPLRDFLKQLAEAIPEDRTIGNTIHKYIADLSGPFIQRVTDHILEYLLTGKTSPLPDASLGGVVEIPFPGQKILALVATEGADLRQLIMQFRQKHREIFPKKRAKLSRSTVQAATNVRLSKLEGYKLKDIADIYIARHPSEFPRDPLTPEYRAAKKALESRIKKQMQRLKDLILRLGDT